jgi:hypothetical protein
MDDVSEAAMTLEEYINQYVESLIPLWQLKFRLIQQREEAGQSNRNPEFINGD